MINPTNQENRRLFPANRVSGQKMIILCKCLAYLILFVKVGIANASDLSIGVKGLKLGMPEEAVLASLKTMTRDSGGLFVPACKKEGKVTNCLFLTLEITYGRSKVALVRIEFVNGVMTHLHFTLSMAGCSPGSHGEMHPTQQFEELTNLLDHQFGQSDHASANRKGWLDDSAMLVVELSPPEEGMNSYPGCSSTKVNYIDMRRAMERHRENAKARGL